MNVNPAHISASSPVCSKKSDGGSLTNVTQNSGGYILGYSSSVALDNINCAGLFYMLAGCDSVTAKSLAAVVQALLDALPVEPERVYATGAGAGGTAVWRLAVDLPGRFAALAPISGLEFQSPDLAERLRGVPVRIITGVKNGFATDCAKRMSAALAKNDPQPGVIYEMELGAEVAQHYYANAALYNWLLAQQRGGPQPPRKSPVALHGVPAVMLGLAGALFLISVWLLSGAKGGRPVILNEGQRRD